MVISEQTVNRIWTEISGYTSDTLELEFSLFGERQPDLTAFIIEFTQDQKQKTAEIGLYIFFVVCRIFEKSTVAPIRKISQDEIEAVFEKNEQLIEHLEGVHTRMYERIAKVQFFSQPFVMKYILEAMAEESDKGHTLSKKETGYLFFLLKTIIDVLDKAI